METAAGLLKFLALNGATVAAGLGLASRLPLASRSERLLAAAVLATGLANASALALGLLGWLSYGPLLATQATAAALGLALARRAEIATLLDPRTLAPLLRGWPLRLSLALVALAYAYAVFLACIGESFGGDELMYHLPLVAEYARTGRIGVPELGPFWANRYWAWYPGGAYLLYLWFVLPFGGGALVDLVQLPYAAGAALATYVLARLFEARRRDALWAALLLLSVPIVLNQMKTTLVDVTLTFLFSAGMAFLLRAPLDAARIALGAIAWGVAPGVKLPAPTFILFGALAVSLRQLEGRSWSQALRALVPAGAAVALATALLSGFWFVRNALQVGSPLYPLNLSPEAPTAWTNIVYYGLLFPLIDFNPFVDGIYNYETGAGPQYFGLAVPAALAFAVATLRQRRAGLAAAALLPIAIYFLWLFRLSTSVQTLLRYVVPALPLGLAAWAWLMTRGPHRRWLAGLAAACVVFGVVTGAPRLGTYTHPGSLRAGLAAWRRGEAGDRFDVMGAVDLQDYRRTWNFLETVPGSQDVATVHQIFSYPLMGSDFRHRIHAFEEREPRRWLKELERRGVDYVAVAELVDPTAAVLVGEHSLALEIDYSPATDELLLATRTVGRRVTGLRLRYSAEGADDARAFVAANRGRHVWPLPLPAAGEVRGEEIPWTGELGSVELMLEVVPRTRMRAAVRLNVEGFDLRLDDGSWVPLLGGDGGWEVLRWPLEFYWMEQRPDRFELVLRDVDHWGSEVSGESRLYQVLPAQEGDDGA